MLFRSTDHAPHPYDAKEQEFDYAPFGVVGLETALGLALVELVDTGTLTLPGLVRCLTTNPAVIAHLPGGTLRTGAPGDVVVLDPDATWTVDPAFFFSKSRNTPFTGRTLRGQVRWTLVGGVVVHRMGDRPGLS